MLLLYFFYKRIPASLRFGCITDLVVGFTITRLGIGRSFTFVAQDGSIGSSVVCAGGAKSKPTFQNQPLLGIFLEMNILNYGIF